MEKEFNTIIDMMKTKDKKIISKYLSEENKLDLYKYYKQAITGDCNIEKPNELDYEAYMKWKYWNSIQGMTRENAIKNYISLYNYLLSKYCLSSYFDSWGEL